MSQREALLSLHGSLGADVEEEDARRRLFSSLTDQRFLAAEPPGGKEPRSNGSLQPEADSLSEVLTAVDDTEEIEFGSADHPVLRAEVLEALVAVALRHSFADSGAFASDPTLLRMARRLVADPANAADLLQVIFDNRQEEQLVAAQPQLLRADHHGGQFSSAQTTPSQSTLTYIQGAISGAFALAPGLAASAGAEPGAHCLARLVPVSIGGQGEYALSFRTTVDPVELPLGLAVVDFVTELFDPANWPSRHPFWCSMQQENPANHAPAAPDLMNAMAQAQLVGEAAGATYGHRRVYREAVGTCSANGGQGTWPNTILVFADSHIDAADGSKHHYLEYRLVPDASPSLSLDDGTIQVIERGQQVAITVTKMLFFNETEYSSQAELMAEYACISGWADQTRLFLMNWLNSP